MKRILCFIVSFIMVLSTGVFSAFSLDNETEILPPYNNGTKDEASKDEASEDESSADEASTDEGIITSMVYDYFLTLTEGRNPFVAEPGKYFDGYNISYTLDVVYICEENPQSRFAVVDLNYPEDTYEVTETVVKIGDSLLINEVDTRVAAYLGMGYYVVLLDEGKVFQLREALKSDMEQLKEVCLEKRILRLVGDTDNNCVINVRDATYIQKMIAGFEGYEADEYYGMGFEFNISDFNGDYDVNIRDVTNIQKYLADMPFDFMGSMGVNYTEIPKSAKPLAIEVVKDKDGSYSSGDIDVIIKNAEDYTEITGEESEVYNEAFFEENYLIFVRRTFGSGCFDLDIKGVYLDETSSIYLDTCFMREPPGYAITDDVVIYRAFITVQRFSDKDDEERIIVFEDNDFSLYEIPFY